MVRSEEVVDFSVRPRHFGLQVVGEGANGRVGFFLSEVALGVGFAQMPELPKHPDHVGVVGADENVVDIVIRDEKYEGRDGMKQGATGYYMKKVYGKPERVQLDGATYNVYYNPENKKERLMLKTDTMNNTLLSWRLTSLPITEEEADDRYDEWESNELGAMGISIDASAMSESGNASYEDGRFTKFEDDGIDGGNVIDGGDPDMIARDNAAKKARE